MKFQWEEISIGTQRAKVFGGWVLYSHNHGDIQNCEGNALAFSESMVFIPDPNHQWSIE